MTSFIKKKKKQVISDSPQVKIVEFGGRITPCVLPFSTPPPPPASSWYLNGPPLTGKYFASRDLLLLRESYKEGFHVTFRYQGEAGSEGRLGG